MPQRTRRRVLTQSNSGQLKGSIRHYRRIKELHDLHNRRTPTASDRASKEDLGGRELHEAIPYILIRAYCWMRVTPQAGSGDEAFDEVHVVEEVPSSPELIEDLNLAREKPREEECSTDVVAIAGEYTNCITCTAWKTQMRGIQQVMVVDYRNRITVPTMIFDGHDGQHFSSPHSDPLVV
ncbi:hypothetical protein Cgig2_024377 [Carnegiea gigantea]|uniref:Uncharacterized protein n=1 Tax=Carnegiea gigantea TaxID=171969 RepID=A0A9Q1GRU5_9CARY|nr:hypothetical protein Cgig2_024377 [Carnegiea gigantea]